MAYQARRREFVEDFELVNSDGSIAHSLQVKLDPDSVANSLSKKYTTLLSMQAKLKKVQDAGVVNPVEDIEKFGNAILELIEGVFGKEDAGIILGFYDDDHYFEMAQEVLPFIADIVVPQIRSMAKQNKKSTLSGYNRKQRRSFMKGI